MQIYRKILIEMELNLINFHTRFPDEDACYEYVVQKRWPDGLACLHCGSVKVYTCKTRRIFKCGDCRRQFSALIDTIFQDTHLPLRIWFMAIYLQTTGDLSTLKMSQKLGITRKTAQHLTHRIMKAMEEEGLVLQGRVAVDEMYHGPKAKGRSAARYQKKYAVLGGVEQLPNGRVALEVVKQPDTTVAMDFFAAHIKPGTSVSTDESRIYNMLRHRYDHATVNHSQRQYVDMGITTNHIENVWHHVRRKVRVHIHLSGKYLSHYLIGGFQFKYNYRHLSDGERFAKWFDLAWGKTLPYKQMLLKKAVQPLALRGWARKRAAMPVQMLLF